MSLRKATTAAMVTRNAAKRRHSTDVTAMNVVNQRDFLGEIVTSIIYYHYHRPRTQFGVSASL